MTADEFDSVAYNYAAFDDAGSIIGSVRVVPDSALGLPLERCHPLNSFREGKRLAEVCRLATVREYRGSRLGGLLMKAAYRRCIAIHATHIVLDSYIGQDAAGALYEKMGFERIGGPYMDNGYNCDLPVIVLALDVAKADAEWPADRPGLHRFFTSPAPEICE